VTPPAIGITQIAKFTGAMPAAITNHPINKVDAYAS
jgi:hypothetical protein